MVSVCRLTWPTLESRQTQEEERLLAQHTSEQFSAMHSTNLRAHFVILPSLRQGPQVFHELDKSRMRIARLHDESRMTRRLATCNSLRRGIPIRGTKDRKPSIAHAQRCRHNSREKRGSHIFRRLICLRWQESIASTRREYAFCYHNATTISRQHDICCCAPFIHPLFSHHWRR
jgi:hypothetical protein